MFLIFLTLGEVLKILKTFFKMIIKQNLNVYFLRKA